MIDKQKLSTPAYEKPRKWIADMRANGKDWAFIENLGKSTKSVQSKLEQRVEDDEWPALEVQDWLHLVQLRKDSEAQTLSFGNLISTGDAKNGAKIPTGMEDSWPKYKKMLEVESHFPLETIETIEKSTHKILNELSAETEKGNPVKGLVIGNVQSGKTANMAALMAMAADNGWNMFIILSGTIENLRIQTYERLLHDLNYGNSKWSVIEHPSKKDMQKNAVSYHFEPTAYNRYFTVCLKQANRLKSLIQWLLCVPDKLEQMRILIIDDEADQAGIDTADVRQNEWTSISNLIGNLFLGKDEKGNDVRQKAMAMNYVGYTATPYANILNSGLMKSLYPKDFICTLSVSKEYFGPQQIFGLRNGQYKGLDIIREIPVEEVSYIKDIHNGNADRMPASMESAVCWFLCSLAQLRAYHYKKPISMLIHTHQKTDSHTRIAKVVDNWFKQTSKENIIDKCRTIWLDESNRFAIKNFKEQYPDYSNYDIRDYLPFADIEPIIRKILEVKKPLAHIEIDSKGDIQYFEGIHLCIDNSVNNRKKSDKENIRLLYPKEDLGYAPAFIVIGGATLSRGLTIEGLVSTYFLRTVKQADTLMQMGRWFGYRRGYEMLPRIWMSDNTKEKFEYLSELDQTLRDEIAEMEVLGEKPTEYGAKILMSDNTNKIKISGANRIQSAVDASMNYMGAYCQTTLFPNDKKQLEDNLELTQTFVDTLGAPVNNSGNLHAASKFIWRNVHFDKIKVYLRQFHFVDRQKFFGNIANVIEWVNKSSLGPWNVIVSNLDNPQNGIIELSNLKVSKVSRTRLASSNAQPSEICIGALRDPKDLTADIDLTTFNPLTQEEIDEIKQGKTKNIKSIRAKMGLDKTPQLIIYFIDKDSKPQPQSVGRIPLNAPEDIVGLCVNIPGERTPYGQFAESVSIDLSTVES